MRATKTLPKITIQKDYSFYISTDDTLHPEGLKLETCELIAFNTGDFVKVKTKELGHSLSLDNHRFQKSFQCFSAEFPRQISNARPTVDVRRTFQSPENHKNLRIPRLSLRAGSLG